MRAKPINCMACGKFVGKHGYIERDLEKDTVIDALCVECYIKELKCRIRCLAQRVVLAEEFMHEHELLYSEDGVKLYETQQIQYCNRKHK